MLRPSKFNKESGLWVWTPDYDEDNDKDENIAADNTEEVNDEGGPSSKEESGGPSSTEEKNTAEDSSYVMELGDQIRFKVKSINFTQVTKTAKGMQATTTTTAQSVHPNMMGGPGGKSSDAAGSSIRKGSLDSAEAHPVRKRSLSVDLTESQNVPASMHVVASICEDGLGLTSWWEAQEAEDEEEAEKE